MDTGKIFVSELSTTKHTFTNYHFCRGNSNKRKTRIGVILKGNGSYIYLNKRLTVTEGDVVFVPENIYCYSEWRGTPEIEVVYVSCFMHYDGLGYEPQVIPVAEEDRALILCVSELLQTENTDVLEAYSVFYRLLKHLLPRLSASGIVLDKTLQSAIEYVTNHWSRNFSIAELARHCCISESALYHLFRRELGQTPLQLLHSIRINVAIEHLENSQYSIATISRLAGFRSENHFRKIFHDFTGTTPLKYRKNR